MLRHEPCVLQKIFLLEIILYDAVVPSDWNSLVAQESEKPYFQALQQFLSEERRSYKIYPPAELTYAALDATPLSETRVVILGQDPYHGQGQAHGLCFSVQLGMAIPPSLRNVFQELRSDLGVEISPHGNLSAWTKQGVLLLNTTLTVRAGEAASHIGRGWETFTNEVISLVNQKTERCVFLLWGASARKKKPLITNQVHVIFEAPHPSPLSAHTGFFGSKPFSQTNSALRESGLPEINWDITSQ
jgi:uracil-DNA glycosylase